MEWLINVIIPVYNPIHFERVVNSLNAQTDKEHFEVIFVNDCGTEDFIELLKDANFKYLVMTTPQNMGQGLARQYALDRCTGTWVTFLDHDDMLTPVAIECAYNKINETGCDFVFSTQSLVCNDDNWIMTKAYLIEDSHCVLHGKFYNVEKLRHYNIRFTDQIRNHEDTYFLARVRYTLVYDADNLNDNSIVWDEQITYIWFLWADSQTHNCVGLNTFISDHFHEYIWAIYYGHEHVARNYPPNSKVMHSCYFTALFLLYYFVQYFKYWNVGESNDKYIERVNWYLNRVIEDTGIDFENIVKTLMGMPDQYHEMYVNIQQNLLQHFIPCQTIEDFMNEVYNYSEGSIK